MHIEVIRQYTSELLKKIIFYYCSQTDKDAAQDKLDQAEQESDGLEASPLDELISPLYDFPQSNCSLQADPELTSNDQTVEELTANVGQNIDTPLAITLVKTS